MNPYGTFFVIHFEVGDHTKSLEHQISLWPTTIDLVALADRYKASLTLQFNPQWAEFILEDPGRVNLINRWQQQGHEVGLHHHGYDHGDWNGYTNRPDKDYDPKFRGNIADMMKLMGRLVGPNQLFSGTITDEKCDYPQGLKYDTEGIRIDHARSKPKLVALGGHTIIQVGMGFLSFEGNIDGFKQGYLKSKKNEIFGVVSHEKDFAKNPAIIEEWLRFVRGRDARVQTVCGIITDYQNKYLIEQNNKPWTFSSDVKSTRA